MFIVTLKAAVFLQRIMVEILMKVMTKKVILIASGGLSREQQQLLPQGAEALVLLSLAQAFVFLVRTLVALAEKCRKNLRDQWRRKAVAGHMPMPIRSAVSPQHLETPNLYGAEFLKIVVALKQKSR